MAQLDPRRQPGQASLGRHQAGDGDQGEEAAGESPHGQQEEPSWEGAEEEGGNQGSEEIV